MTAAELLVFIRGNAAGAIDAFRQTTNEAKGFGAAIKQQGSEITAFGKSVTLAASPLIALGTAAIAAKGDIDTAFRQLRIAAGDSSEKLAVLKGDFKAVFSSVPASAKDAGAAIADLNKLTGATGETLQGLAAQNLNLARITGSELKPQIEATSQAFNSFGVGAQEQGGKLDYLFKVSQQTGVGVTQLAQQMAQSGGVARSAGLSFETSAALIGQLSKYGIDATSVMSGFSKSLTLIARKGGDADPTAVLASMVKEIKEAGSASQVNALAVRDFGRSGIAMGEAIKSGRLDVEGVLATLKGSKDTINKTADDTRTFGESMTVMKNQVELALQPLGVQMRKALNDLMPLFKDAVGWVTSLAKKFLDLDPSTQKLIGGFVLVAGAIGPVTAAVGKLTGVFSAILGPVSAAIGGIVGLLGGPLTLAVVAVVGIVAVMVSDWASGASSMGKASNLLYDAILFVAGAFGVVMDALGVVGSVVKLVIDQFVLLGHSLYGLGQFLTGDFSGAVDTWKSAWSNATDSISQDFENISAHMQGSWTKAMQNMVDTGFDAAGKLGGAGKAGGDLYVKGYINAINNIGPWAEGIMSEADAVKQRLYNKGLEAGYFFHKGMFDATPKTPDWAGDPTRAGPAGVNIPKRQTVVPIPDDLTDMWRKQADALNEFGFKVTEKGKQIGAKIPAAIAAGIGGGGHKVKAASAAMIDEFKSGVEGFDAAIKTITANQSKLAGLFDPTTKAAKAGGESLRNALKSVADNINDFLNAAGSNAKINIAELAANWDKYNAVIGKTDAYEHLKDALNSVNLDRVVAGFQTFDDKLKITGNQIEISENAFQALKAQFPQIVSEVAKAGLKFHEVFPAIGAEFVGLEKYTDASLRQMDQWADGFEKSQFQATEAMQKTMAEAPHWAGAIVDSAERIKVALQNQSGELLRVRAALDIRSSIDSAIGDFQRYGEMIGLSGQQLQDYVENKTRAELSKIPDITREQLDLAIEQHKRAANALPPIWESIFHDLDSKSRQGLNGVFAVIDSLPGKWGDSLRKSQSEVEKWLKFLDSTTKLIQNILGQQVTGLGGFLKDITGLFKSAQTSIQGLSTGIVNSAGLIIKNIGGLPVAQNKPGFLDPLGLIPDLTQVAGKVAGDATKAGAAIGGNITSGISSFLSSGAGIMAAVTGALGLAISTFQSESKTKRFLGGFALGGPIGGILSVIFGGPSELQKAQNAAALQQARDAIKLSQQSVEQALEQTKQSLLETVSKVKDILEGLRFYDRIGKPAIKGFFKDLDLFMRLLADEASKWKSFASSEIKATAENLAAGVDLIAKLPAVLSAIGTYFKLGQGQLDVFFADADALFARLGEFVSSIPKKIQKQIGKFGDRTDAGIGILSPLLEFIKGALDVKDVPDSAFDTIENTLTRMVERLGKIGDSFKKSFLKMVGFVGENLSPGVSLLSSVLQVIKDAVGISTPSEGDFDNLFDSLKAGVTRMVAFAADLTTEGLSKAQAVATAVMPIAAAIKAWMDVSGLVRGYTAIAADAWSAAFTDFMKGLSWLSSLIDQALDYLDLATKFNDTVTLGNVQLNAGITGFVNGVTGAFAALNQAFGSIQGGEVFPQAGAGAAAQSATSNIAASAASSPHGASQSQTTVINLHVHGNMIHESQIEDLLVRKLGRMQTRGRLKVQIV